MPTARITTEHSRCTSHLQRPERSDTSPMGDEHVVVVSYDPDWPRDFEAERVLLERVLAPWLQGGIHHIGSTAIPGIAAKPIIDIMAGIRDLEESRSAFEPLRGHSYLPEPHRPRIAHHFAKPSVCRHPRARGRRRRACPATDCTLRPGTPPNRRRMDRKRSRSAQWAWRATAARHLRSPSRSSTPRRRTRGRSQDRPQLPLRPDREVGRPKSSDKLAQREPTPGYRHAAIRRHPSPHPSLVCSRRHR